MLRLANSRHDRELVRRACVAWKEMGNPLIDENDLDPLVAGEIAVWKELDGSIRGRIGDDHLTLHHYLQEMEEERRSCFVAITRVQRTLTITLAHRYSGYRKQPSRFLREMYLI
jgi:superfamily I DNA/RNA helicase